jgi:predicted PurR-regulated permease PerM
MRDRFRRFNSGRANFFLVAFIALVLGGALLKITASVFLPFTIALLLSFVIEPMVLFLQKNHVPRFFSIFLAVIVIIAGIFLIGMVLFSSGRTILSLYPKYENRLTEIYIWVARFFELPYDEHLTFFENLWGQLGVRTRVRNITFSLSNSFIGFLTDAFIMVLALVFFLSEAAHIKEKLEAAFERRSDQIIKMGGDIVQQIIRYLSTKFFISLVTGAIVWVALRLNGLEFAVVWGVIQFILNFIPSIGSIVAGVGVTLFALIQFWPDPGPIVITGLVMLGTNIIIGNILEPKIMGDNLGLSPLAVLMSLIIWGWLWGFAGMILAVPMTVIVKIVCENIPMLEPVSIVLGSHRAIAAQKQAEKDREEEGPRGETGPA